MANSYTSNLNLAKPAEGDVDWDDEINGDLDTLDTVIGAEHNSDGTHKNTVNVGDGANSVDKKIVAHTGEGNEPYIAYDVSDDHFVVSNNGADVELILAAAKNVLEVAESGRKYSTIASALLDAASGDVVLIHPGEYSETITVPENVTLLGVDRRKTIIQQLGCGPGPLYLVTLSDGSAVSNFTIKATGQETPPAILHAIRIAGDGYSNVVRNVDINIEAGVATGILADKPELDLLMDGCTIDVYSTLSGQLARGISFGDSNDPGGTLTVINCFFTRVGEGSHSCGVGHVQKFINTTINTRGVGLNVDSSGGNTYIHGCHIIIKPESDDSYARGITGGGSAGNDVKVTSTYVELDLTGADSGVLSQTCAAIWSNNHKFNIINSTIVIKGLSGETSYGIYTTGTNDHYVLNSSIILDGVGTQYGIYEAGSGTIYTANVTEDIDKRSGTISSIDNGWFSRLIVPSGTTPPASPKEGELFLDTDASANGTLTMYSNSAWRTVVAW